VFTGVKSTFDCLDKEKISWTVYFHDISNTSLLYREFHHLTNEHKYAHYKYFDENARDNKLPRYSFIEPRYLNWHGVLANDQHPPHSIAEGEKLIASIYNSLYVDRPHNNNVALLITYDEHGGLYDHIHPPWLPPNLRTNHEEDVLMAWNRYGVRVPAILISPYLQHQMIDHLMDHCSIPATLIKYLAPGHFLHERVSHARSFLDDLKWTSEPSVISHIELPPSKYIPDVLKNENYYFPKSWMQDVFKKFRKLAIIVNPRMVFHKHHIEGHEHVISELEQFIHTWNHHLSGNRRLISIHSDESL